MKIKETEKQEAQAQLATTVSRFEAELTKLYKILKQKEELDEQQQQKLETGLKVSDMKHHTSYTTFLTQSIGHHQQIVQEAREHMHEKEAELLAKNIEVKKYEKIKIKKQAAYQVMINEAENKLMDELSLRQYLKQRN